MSHRAPSLIPPELARELQGIQSWPKRRTLATLYHAAILQREYAESRLANWPPPAVAGAVDAHLITFVCYRDRLLLLRMVASFLRFVGRPKMLTIICHDQLGQAAHTLSQFDAQIEVIAFSEYMNRERLPPIVMDFARRHAFGRKLAVLMKEPTDCPVIYTDTDIEFFRGGGRLASMLNMAERPYYLQDAALTTNSESGYDSRLLQGKPVKPRVNGGFCVFPKPVDWEPALSRLEPFVDSPRFLTEQTVVALLMTQEHGIGLPMHDYVLSWEDTCSPFDRHARADIVLRHYASPVLRWKLWLRGGHRGLKALPQATIATGLRLASRDALAHPDSITDREAPPMVVAGPEENDWNAV